MRSKEYSDYLFSLIRDGQRMQLVNEAGEEIHRNHCGLLSIQWFFVIFSLFICGVGCDSFSDGFVQGVISALAIIVSLSFTVVLSFYDKFSNHMQPEMDEFKTVQQKRNLQFLANFFKKYTVSTLYIILLSLCTILLMGGGLLFDWFNEGKSLGLVVDYFIKGQCKCGVCSLFLVIFRAVVLYFLMDIVYLSMYIIVTTNAFLKGEYDKLWPESSPSEIGETEE